jgi:hypothetical protein
MGGRGEKSYGRGAIQKRGSDEQALLRLCALLQPRPEHILQWNRRFAELDAAGGALGKLAKTEWHPFGHRDDGPYLSIVELPSGKRTHELLRGLGAERSETNRNRYRCVVAPAFLEAAARMYRALSEFRIRGLASNVPFPLCNSRVVSASAPLKN